MLYINHNKNLYITQVWYQPRCNMQ